MATQVRGSCLCGAVRFEADQVLEFRNCHCTRCRKARGADYGPNLLVSPRVFRWVQGEDSVTTYRLPTAARFRSSFCRTCGSPLPWFVSERDYYVIPAGALDYDPEVRATHHIFVGSKAPWHDILDDLPQYAEAAPLREGHPYGT
jgi:hypothetical protein